MIVKQYCSYFMLIYKKTMFVQKEMTDLILLTYYDLFTTWEPFLGTSQYITVSIPVFYNFSLLHGSKRIFE